MFRHWLLVATVSLVLVVNINARNVMWKGGNGNWKDDNWNPGKPFYDDAVFITAPGNYTVTINTTGILTQSITVGTGASSSQGIQSLRIIGAGSLNVLQPTPTLVIGGSGVVQLNNSSSMLTIRCDMQVSSGGKFILSGGKLSGFGKKVLVNGTFEIDSDMTHKIDSATLDIGSTMTISSTSPQSLTLTNANILNRGSLTVSGNYTISGSGTAAMSNFGQLGLSDASSLSLAIPFSNSMSVKVGSGSSLVASGSLVNSGAMNVNGSMTCNSSIYSFTNTSVVSGSGAIQLLQGTYSLNGVISNPSVTLTDATVTSAQLSLDPSLTNVTLTNSSLVVASDISMFTLSLYGNSSVSLPTTNTTCTSQTTYFSGGALQGATFVTRVVNIDAVSLKTLNATLQITEANTWNSGTVQMGGSGVFLVSQNASLLIHGSGTPFKGTGRLVNDGLFWSNSPNGNIGVFVVNNNQTLVTSGSLLFNNGGLFNGSVTFRNATTLKLAGGSFNFLPTSTLSGGFTSSFQIFNNASAHISTAMNLGNLRVYGSATALFDGPQMSIPPTSVFNEFSSTSFANPVTLVNVTLARAARLSSPAATITALTWTGGVLAANASLYGRVDGNAGNKTVDGGAVDVFGSFSVANGTVKLENGASITLRNTSTLTSGGNLSMAGNGTLSNFGLITGNFQNISFNCLFLNFGTVLVDGVLDLLSDSSNWGQFVLGDNSTLHFGGGKHNLISPAVVNGNGTLAVTGAAQVFTNGSTTVQTLAISDNSSFSVLDNLQVSFPFIQLSGSGSLQGGQLIVGSMLWTGGSIVGSQSMNVTTLDISGNGSKTIQGKQVSILGNTMWSGGNIISNASSIHNYGNFTSTNLHASLLDLVPSTNATFSNFGNVAVGSSSSVLIGVLAYHFGTLEVAADSVFKSGAALAFLNGSSTTIDGSFNVGDSFGLQIAPLATLSGNGSLNIGGMATFENGSSLQITTVNLGGNHSAISFASNATLHNLVLDSSNSLLKATGLNITGQFNWNSGLISASDVVVSSSFNISAGAVANSIIEFASLSNGTSTSIQLTNSSLFLDVGSQFRIQGTVSGSNDSSLVSHGTTTVVGNSTISLPVSNFGAFVFGDNSHSSITGPFVQHSNTSSLLIQSSSSVAFASLSLADTSAVVNGSLAVSSLRLEGSNLSGSGPISISSQLLWLSGLISGVSNMSLELGSMVTISNPQQEHVTLMEKNVINHGILNVYSPLSLTSGATILNLGSAVTNASVDGANDTKFENSGVWQVVSEGAGASLSAPTSNSGNLTFTGNQTTVSNFTQADGSATVQSSSVIFTHFVLQNGAIHAVDGKFSFTGPSTWNGGSISLSNSTLTNRGPLTISVASATIVEPVSSSFFINLGSIFIPTPSTLTISSKFINNGSLDADNSTVSLSSDFTQSDSNAVLSVGSVNASGSFDVAGGFVELQSNGSIFADLRLNAGELSGSGGASVSKFAWNSGTLSGSSTLAANSTQIHSTQPKYLTGKTLVNQQNVTFDNALLTMSMAILVNQQGAQLYIYNSSIHADSASALQNLGDLYSYGDYVAVESRVINAADAFFEQRTSANFSSFENSNGSVSVSGHGTSFGLFSLYSGILDVVGDLMLYNISWTSGNIQGAHPVSIATATISSTLPKSTSVPLSVTSTLTVSSGLTILAPLTVAPNATAFLHAATITGNSTLANFGTLVSADGVSEFAVPSFESSAGSVVVQTGATFTTNNSSTGVVGEIEVNGNIDFNGSEFEFGSNATISGNGSMSWIDSKISFHGSFIGSGNSTLSLVIGGSSKVSFNVPVAIPNLMLSDAASINTAFPFNVSLFMWYGNATFGNGSQSNLGSTGSFSILGSGAAKVLNGTSLYNYGITKWISGDILLDSGASIYIQDGSAFHISSSKRRAAPDVRTLSASQGSSSSSLNNSGNLTIEQNTDIQVPVSNSGRLFVRPGYSLRLTTISQSGNGSELHLDGSSLIANSVTNIEGTIRGNGNITAPITNNGTFAVEGPMLIDGPFTQTSAGRLVIIINGNTSQLIIAGHTTLGGVLDVRWITDPTTVTAGQPLEIVSFAGGRSGVFDEIRGLTSSSNLDYPLVYTATSIQVLPTVIPPPSTTAGIQGTTTTSDTTSTTTSDSTTTTGSATSTSDTTSTSTTATTGAATIGATTSKTSTTAVASTTSTSGSSTPPPVAASTSGTASTTTDTTSSTSTTPTPTPAAGSTTGSSSTGAGTTGTTTAIPTVVPTSTTSTGEGAVYQRKSKTAMYIGIAVGAFVALALVIIIIAAVLTRKRRRNTKALPRDNPMNADSSSSGDGTRSSTGEEAPLTNAKPPKQTKSEKKPKRVSFFSWGKGKNKAMPVPNSPVPSPLMPRGKFGEEEEFTADNEGDKGELTEEARGAAIVMEDPTNVPLPASGEITNTPNAPLPASGEITNEASSSSGVTTEEKDKEVSAVGTITDETPKEEAPKAEGASTAASTWTGELPGDSADTSTLGKLPPLIPISKPELPSPKSSNRNPSPQKKQSSPKMQSPRSSQRKPSPARGSTLGSLPPLMPTKPLATSPSKEAKGKGKQEPSPKLGKRKPSPGKEKGVVTPPRGGPSPSPKSPRKNSKEKVRASLPSPLQDPSAASPKMEFSSSSSFDPDLPPVQKLKPAPHKELGPLQKSKPVTPVSMPMLSASPQLGTLQLPSQPAEVGPLFTSRVEPVVPSDQPPAPSEPELVSPRTHPRPESEQVVEKPKESTPGTIEPAPVAPSPILKHPELSMPVISQMLPVPPPPITPPLTHRPVSPPPPSPLASESTQPPQPQS